MDMRKSRKLLLTLAGLYWALVILIYVVAGEQFHYTSVTSSSLSPVASIGEMTDGMRVTQRVINPADTLESLEIMAGGGRGGTLHAVLTGENGETAAHAALSADQFAEGKYVAVAWDTPVEGARGEAMTLTLETEGCGEANPLLLYFGNKVTAGRFDVVQHIADEDLYTLDGEAGLGRLCVRVGGVEVLSFYKTYWVIVLAVFALAAAYVLRCWRGMERGESNVVSLICTIFGRYSFLLRQLVGRDFKAKYKRSALGVAWSFLNPLLSMSVQFVVFSTLFKNDTPNYPVYLLTGIVFFNFFNEAVSVGMTSITGNAHLIKKVYMPKYIYPMARVMSSLINFAFAFMPIVLVMLITGTWPRPAMLLLVFDLLCLTGFVLGMALLLSTLMTFFQDTQFLWGVVSMMWMYLTPIFYTESIIPAKLLTLYHMNPMYQYITFARICIIDGVSPAPTTYLWCILSSVAVLLLGVTVFKKNQDKFVLYL